MFIVNLKEGYSEENGDQLFTIINNIVERCLKTVINVSSLIILKKVTCVKWWLMFHR